MFSSRTETSSSISAGERKLALAFTAPSRSSRARVVARRVSNSSTVPSTSPSAKYAPDADDADDVIGKGVVQSHAGVEYLAEIGATEGEGVAASSSFLSSVLSSSPSSVRVVFFLSPSPLSCGAESCLCCVASRTSRPPPSANITARLHPRHATRSASAFSFFAVKRKCKSGAPRVNAAPSSPSAFRASVPSFSFATSSPVFAASSASWRIGEAPSSAPFPSNGGPLEISLSTARGSTPNAIAAFAAVTQTKTVAGGNKEQSCVSLVVVLVSATSPSPGVSSSGVSPSLASSPLTDAATFSSASVASFSSSLGRNALLFGGGISNAATAPPPPPSARWRPSILSRSCVGVDP
mmetsp:Transcript_11558/g.38207  ORF Transcript_11558/g.38207 Transcript_11558/m.38207 type:complete len:352 (+) Transcript_11558:1169-2224(+)